MSAIAGIYALDGRPIAGAALERMVECLARRGPDGVGVWQDGPIGLGHRMLRTTPESLHESLPLVSTTGDLVLTADARIDNREELIAALGITGRPCARVSDSELILGAYEQWGDRCPEKLLGDFAFALWDRRKRTLFCARDHFGVKPFYYYCSSRAFVFASEIKGILCLPEVPRRLNEVRVAEYLMPRLLLEDKAITFYRDILRLPPGHCLSVSPEGMQLQAYWSLDPTREIHCHSDGEYAEAFREIFTEAVRCRLRSAFPIGSMLSGGLDSSSIVCVARQLLAKEGARRLHTFSAIFKDIPKCNEQPFIEAVLAAGEIETHFVYADQLNPLADIDHILWHQDEAFFGPNLYMHWGLYSVAKTHGVRVIFDGFDGDTTVSHGVAYLTELAYAWRWPTLAREIAGLSMNFKVSPWKLLWQRSIVPLAPQSVRQAWRRLRRGRQPQEETIINPAFARRMGTEARYEAVWQERVHTVRTSREDHWRSLSDALVPYILEVADRAAATFLLQPVFPFFDKRLAEFCLALPPEQKLTQGWTRVVMRRAMSNLLPTEIQWRPGKTDYSPMLTQGLLAFNRNRVEEVILHDLKVLEGYVDVTALRGAYQRYASRGTPKDALLVWSGVTLALWLRQTGLSS